MKRFLTLTFVTSILFILFMLIVRGRVDLDYPKYYNMKCVVIRTGSHKPVKGIQVPKTYIVIQATKDSSLRANLNSLNFPSFIDNQYKVGDTLYFKFIAKKRFGENQNF